MKLSTSVNGVVGGNGLMIFGVTLNSETIAALGFISTVIFGVIGVIIKMRTGQAEKRARDAEAAYLNAKRIAIEKGLKIHEEDE